jgi:hypothetical protein
VLSVGVVAACWLAAAMLLALGGLVVNQTCASGSACADGSAYRLVGHAMRALGWVLFVAGPLLAGVAALTRRRARLRRRLARALAAVAASWL